MLVNGRLLIFWPSTTLSPLLSNVWLQSQHTSRLTQSRYQLVARVHPVLRYASVAHDAAMQAMSKDRRKRANHQNIPNPYQALLALSSQQLEIHITEGSLWLAAPPRVISLLHACALGSNEGGPCTAQDTANRINGGCTPASTQASPGLVSVRLSPEEAFFLKFALGSVSVNAAAGKLSVQELWSSCMRQNSEFPHRYTAYHHFRGKGWIPRSGLQYGADLVLYEQHPSLVHSTVCVLIVPVKVGSLEACSNSAIASNQSWDGQLPWHSVEGINRLCTRVGKKLMLFYVQQPEDADLASPGCLDKFVVAEKYVERWVPEATVNLL